MSVAPPTGKTRVHVKVVVGGTKFACTSMSVHVSPSSEPCRRKAVGVRQPAVNAVLSFAVAQR